MPAHEEHIDDSTDIADLRPAARRLLVLATALRRALFSDFDGRYPRLLIGTTR